MHRHKKSIGGESTSSDIAVAVTRVFEKLAAILVRLGIDSPRGEELLRRAFISEAARIARFTGCRSTQSQIALLAGVNRLDVRRIMDGKQQARSNSIPQSRIERLLAAWRTDPEFSSGRGRPKGLSFSGSASQFEKLIRKYGRDVSVRSLREHLLANKLAIERSGRLLLVDHEKKSNRAKITAAMSDLRFLHSQLAPFDFYQGRRAFQSRYLSVHAEDIKTLKLIQRKAVARIDTTLSSLESVGQSPHYKTANQNKQAHLLRVMTIVSSESRVKNKRRQ